MLGPTLFLCYINNMTSRNFEGGVRIYADARAVFVTGTTAQKLQDGMNRNLCKLSCWATDRRLSVNASKTKYMIFGNRNRLGSEPLKLRLGDTELGRVLSYNYLGFCLDEALNFTTHINQVVSSCNPKISWLAKIKFIDEKITVNLYINHSLCP